jgi:hypothetical protein
MAAAIPATTSPCCSSETMSSEVRCRRGDEERVEESGDDRQAGDIDGCRSRERFARAAMRLRQQREQRRDAAEEGEHRWPREPGAAAQHQFLGRPSGQAERRHRETQRDGRPEKPLASAPRLAPRHDDAGGDERWNEQGQSRGTSPAPLAGRAASTR